MLSLVFSDSEDVHCAKCQWIIGFKDLPIIEVHERCVAEKKCPKFLEDRWFNLEPLKRKALLVQKRLDFRDCKSVFHDIEQQVPASAHAVEVACLGHALPASVIEIT